MLNLSMSYKQDLENAVRRIFVEAYPTGKGNPLNKVYEPTDTISDEQWKKIKRGYVVTFTILPNINENVVSGYLDMLWENWNRGGYQCSEDFINKLDVLFDNLREVQAKKNKKSFLDEDLYDDLFEEFQEVINQRTWDDSITDKLLKDKAMEHQTDIEVYLEKRVKHGLELTDKMLAFKGVEDLTRENYFKEELKPQLPKPPKPEDIAKTKEKYSVRYKIPSKQVPTHYQGDYDANWKCAMEMRRLHCIGQFGTFKDITIYECYDWAVENCTVKGKPIKHRNKLINGYDNAKRKTKSDIIIAKFEEDYYE